MIRKYLFSEELGRNIIWVMLSGFFLKIGAKENLFGQIIMPKGHYLFNLDDKNLDLNYLKFDHLHYIFFDGSTEFLNDERFKQIKKRTNIYYVGQLNQFWKNIENSQPLFNSDLNTLIENIEHTKKKFPFFYKKYFLKNILTTISGIRNFRLTANHVVGKKKYVYYGYIKPTRRHLDFYQNKLGINKYNFEIFFESTKNQVELNEKINLLCKIKNDILNSLGKECYPYLNEFCLFMIRNLICNILKKHEKFLIYDGLGGDQNFNAYEMFFGKQHIYLDLGSKVGFDSIYPRYALLKLFNRDILSLNLDENSFYSPNEVSKSNLYNSVNDFLNKLNIKI